MSLARARFKVTDRDRGLDAITREVAKAQGYVKVGVLQDAGQRSDGKLSNAELAFAHEFGAGRVHERSFLRSSFDANRGNYLTLMGRMVPLIYDRKMTGRQMLELMGQRAAADTKARIVAGLHPDISEATKRRKGSSTPLIDTGQLINSITYAFIDTSPEARAAATRAKAAKQKARAAKKAARRQAKRAKAVGRAKKSLTRTAKAVGRRGRSIGKSLRRSSRQLSRSASRTGRAASRGLKRTRRTVTRGAVRQAKAIRRSVKRGARSARKSIRRTIRGLK